MTTVTPSMAQYIGVVASIAHEANRGYCESIGDHSQPSWEDAPDWQRASAIAGVHAHIDGHLTPEQSHERWMEHKRRDGWTYGPTKDLEAKTHPCMVPYSELPLEQRSKDYIFQAVVAACWKYLDVKE